ncbi:MAG: hypothetical protein HYS13_06305 [Planctomycetia bacterium]|nr:hypothetical protein [Planctomycetia bacterium]
MRAANLSDGRRPGCAWALGAGIRCLGSPRLTAVLWAALLAALAWAAAVEANQGQAHASWFVYESRWFAGLLLLGAHSSCAVAVRFPWRRRDLGLVALHVGVLVLLTGAVSTHLGGIKGRVSLVQDQTTNELLRDDQDQMTVARIAKPDGRAHEFRFAAGPVDWPAGKALSVGEVDGARVRILGYVRHARAVETWTADNSGSGGPLVKFKVAGQDGTTIAEHWLFDQSHGDAVMVGPIRLQLQQAASEAMLEDFLQPPAEVFAAPAEKGTLVMYYREVVRRVSVDEYVGETIALCDATVEIAEYLPNAAPDRLGNFTSKSDQPKNPMLELRVCVAGEEKPIRQIAFAKDALLNLDGVYSRPCPVRFRYVHPAIEPPAALEFLQAQDGKLYARLCAGRRCESCGEVKPPARIRLPGDFEVTILEYLPRAAHDVTFQPVGRSLADMESEDFEPAALVEVTAGGATRQVWLQRGHLVYGSRQIDTPAGTLSLSYEQGRAPLGFTLTMVDVGREENPAQRGNSSLPVKVRVVDEQTCGDEVYEVSSDKPLTLGGFTFYPTGVTDAGHGRAVAAFRVVSDPGWPLKCAGWLLVGAGIVVILVVRFRTHRAGHEQDAPALDGAPPVDPSSSFENRAAA